MSSKQVSFGAGNSVSCIYLSAISMLYDIVISLILRFVEVVVKNVRAQMSHTCLACEPL